MKIYSGILLLLICLNSNAKGYPPGLGVCSNNVEELHCTAGYGLSVSGHMIPNDSIHVIYIYPGDSLRLGAGGGYDGVDQFQIFLGEDLLYENNLFSGYNTGKTHYVKDTGYYSFYADNDVGSNSMHFRVAFVEILLSKEEPDFKPIDLYLYPNPASHEISLFGGASVLENDCSISIMNLEGKTLETYTFYQVQYRSMIQIPIDNIPNGIYILLIWNSQLYEQRKFIKQ